VQAVSFLSAATVWWDTIRHNTKKKGKQTAVTDVPSNVQGISSEELRPWAPYVAFLQALTRLHEVSTSWCIHSGVALDKHIRAG
jgi:hypothetical protein